MKISEKTAAVEAVLFACGDPVDPARLAEAAGVDKGALNEIAAELNAAYEENGSSLIVLTLGGSFQLAVRQEYFAAVETAARTKKNVPLSQAAMEALTIIAYNQPVTKSFIESVRGVDSSGVVNSLAEKGLVCEAGRLDLPGRPIAYKTTEVFLRCFGLSSLDELPPLPGKEEVQPEQVLLEEVTDTEDLP